MFHPYSFYLQKHKNAKIKRESALPFSASPYYFTSLSIPPMSQTAFYYVSFRLLGCPILPFGVSHFAIWGIFSAHLPTPHSPAVPDLASSFSLPKFVSFSFLSVHHVSSGFAWLDKIYFIILSSITLYYHGTIRGIRI